MNTLFTAVTTQLGSRLKAIQLPPDLCPAGGVGPISQDWSILYEVWVSSTGVYGHLPSSLSHWGLSAVLMELILARLSVVDVIMFFWKDRAQREGRSNAHPIIKTPPEHQHSRACGECC